METFLHVRSDKVQRTTNRRQKNGTQKSSTEQQYLHINLKQ